MWKLKQSAVPGALDMYIYGYVEPDSYDWWTDEVIESETSANHFRNELAKYPDIQQINIISTVSAAACLRELQSITSSNGTQHKKLFM